MSEFKGVEILGPVGTDVLRVVDKHAGATKVRVIDGHLYVDHPENGIVAIYAPGRWNGTRIAK